MMEETKECGCGRVMTRSAWGNGDFICLPCVIEREEDEWYASTMTHRVANGLCLQCGDAEAVIPSLSTTPIKAGGKYCVECSMFYAFDVDPVAVNEAVKAKQIAEAEEKHLVWLEGLEEVCSHRDYRLVR